LHPKLSTKQVVKERVVANQTAALLALLVLLQGVWWHCGLGGPRVTSAGCILVSKHVPKELVVANQIAALPALLLLLLQGVWWHCGLGGPWVTSAGGR
jgi:hypothetical protein